MTSPTSGRRADRAATSAAATNGSPAATRVAGPVRSGPQYRARRNFATAWRRAAAGDLGHGAPFLTLAGGPAGRAQRNHGCTRSLVRALWRLASYVRGLRVQQPLRRPAGRHDRRQRLRRGRRDRSGGAVGSSSSFGNGGTSSGTSLGTGVCETGFYSGTFSCFFFYGIDAGIGEAPDSGGIGPITGTMSFKLTQDVSSHGELETTDTASGTFDAATGLFIAADADLSGTLDCTQGKFTGQLVNGEYGFNIGGMPIPDPNNRFQGPLVADYNGSTSTFVNGQWSMMVAGEGPCIGSWTAAYAGPLDGGVDGAPPSPADASRDRAPLRPPL